MASINKLSIRGVRAFSPDDQEQVIEFCFPVTIIVGANGCGKTTIIESLKYAVTGSLPPGNKSGQAFVHDPKSIGQSVVKANIKLRFTNRAGTSMVVVRSMELTQKKASLTFKALDGILRTTDPRTGERMSMSHKCTELDRQIPMLLGVSKPILEHVVFCHQEDSSWPLMEGAVLKKRFDDIFDSTRYAKALKAIQETKKEYTGIVKDLKADLNGLASHKHAAKGFRQELEQHNEQLEELEEDLSNCREEIKKVEAELARNNEIAGQIEELKLEIDDRKAEMSKEESVLDTQRAMLAEDLTKNHSSRDLKDMLRDFDEEVDKQLDRRHELERDCQILRSAMDTIREDDLKLRGQIGKLMAEKEAHEKLLQRRLAKMEQIATTYGIELQVSQTQNTTFTATQGSLASETVGGGTQDTAISVSKEDMAAFFKAVDAKEEECKENLRSHRDQTQKQGDHIQDQLGELNAKMKAIEHDKEKLDNEQTDIRTELTTLNSQAPTHTRIRKSDIEDTKRQAVHYAKERDKANSNKRLKEIPIEIRSHETAIDKAKREIEYDQQAIRELRTNAEAQNSVRLLKEQTGTELESLQESLSDSAYTIQKYNLQIPNPLPGVTGGDEGGDELMDAIETLGTAIRDKYATVQDDLTRAKNNQDSKQRVVSEKSALLSHSKQNLASLRSKLDVLGAEEGNVRKFQRVVASIRQYELGAGTASNMQGTDPQEVLGHLSSRIEELEASSMDALQPEIVSKVVNQLLELSKFRDERGKVVDLACPCCRRKLVTTDESKIFKDAMAELKDAEKSELLRVDTHLAEKNRAAKANYQRWRKAVQESMHDVLNYNRINTEIKDTEVTITDIESDLTGLQSELDGLKGESSDLEATADELRGLVDVSKRWTEDAVRLSRKKMEIKSKQVDLSIGTSHIVDRDLETVEEDVNKRMAEKDDLMEKIAALNKSMTDLNNQIAKLSSQATRFEGLAREKQAKYDEEQEANVRKAELTKRLATISEEEKKLHTEMNPLRQKIRGKESERSRLRAATKEEEERLSDTLSSFNADVSELRQIMSQIDSYVDSSKGQDLDHIDEKITSLRQRMKDKEAELQALEPELELLTRNIDDKERQKKLIKENLDVLASKERIKVLEKDLGRLSEDIGKIEGHDTCAQIIAECRERKATLLENRARYEGRRGGVIEQIRTLKRKLKTPEYDDIDERYRIVMIKHETTQIAVSDLDKYYAALDKALLTYHGIKIGEINRIIRELWTLTYKGEDISNIELKSGQESGSKAAKSYNYRVVMTKGSTQLDMRGRCSAGQRVLASIVIRLALAETFCVNCGCIALDEPTVNLDYNNKRGLAIALAQIIASRSQQSNFQLVIITHDEDFVSMMKNEMASTTGFTMPDKYFQVRREEGADGKHYSKIDAIDWDELV